MKDVQVLYNILKDYSNKNLTTKELNELGITRHFINKLLEKRKLERVEGKRGLYHVRSIAQSKQTFFAIRNFSDSVIAGNYEKAYNYLMRCYEVRQDNKSDNLIRIGFTLLQEILENKDPFATVNDLQELILEERDILLYWNKFCTDVVNNDYLAAKDNIAKSAELQVESQGFVGNVTNAMINLVGKVLEIKEDKVKLAEYVEHINGLISENKYEEAIRESNKKLDSINDDKLREKFKSLIELIRSVIVFRDDDNIVLNNEQSATYANNNPKILLAFYLRDKDYLKSLNYIEDVCRENPDTYNKLVEKLLLELKELNISHKQNAHKVSVNDANYHFRKFLNIFSIDNLEESMQELSLSLSYTHPSNINYLRIGELLKIFKKLIKMRDKEETFEEMNINYNLKNEPMKNFNYAIQNGDYKKANAFSHLITIKNSSVLDIKRQLLNEMNRLDKINREKQASTPIAEPSMEVIEEKESEPSIDSTNQPEVVEEKGIIEETKEPEKEQTNEQTVEQIDDLIDESLREEAAKLELDYDTIYNLVYDRKYDLAYALVERDKDRGDLDRLCTFTSRLIKRIKKLEKGVVVPAHPSEPTGEKFRDFYRAIRDCNYNYAYSLVDELICDLTEKSDDSTEMDLYKLLLEDIKDMHEKIQDAKEEIEILSENVYELSIKPDFTRGDIQNLIEMLKRKIKLKVEISKPYDIDASLLNIAEMTILSLDGKLNNTDFREVECESEVASDIFIAAIDQGDYPTCKKLIQSVDWKDVGGIYNFTFLRLAKKMLNMMIPHLRLVIDQSIDIEKTAEEEILEEVEVPAHKLPEELTTPEKVEELRSFLHEMRALIKERHYEEVYQTFVKSDLPIAKLENTGDIFGNLAFIKSSLDKEANKLYETYESSLENNDSDSIEHLNAYKKFITENYMEESAYHKQKMLKSQE